MIYRPYKITLPQCSWRLLSHLIQRAKVREGKSCYRLTMVKCSRLCRIAYLVRLRKTRPLNVWKESLFSKLRVFVFIQHPQPQWGMGCGNRGFQTSRLMCHAFPAPAPFFFASSLHPFFDCEVLDIVSNFLLFLPLPTLLELLSPALSALVSSTLPAPYPPGFPNPCLPTGPTLPHSQLHEKNSLGVTTNPSNRAALPSSCGSWP